MGYAGNKNTPATKAYCHRQYWLMRNSQLYWTLQNTWTYPTAQTYVNRLFREAPHAKEPVQGQLAVITNIAAGGSSYYVAEELALNAGMHLVLLSKKKEKLRTIEESLSREAKRRGISTRRPTIFKVHYDPLSIASVLQAAQDVHQIASHTHYQSKLPLLVHNPAGVTMHYETTPEGVEINVGRNFVAPLVLTQHLLPLLQAAATAVYKPRIVYVSSVGHCQGTDFDPERFLAMPDEGGAPEGTLVTPAEQQQQPQSGDYAAAASDETTTTTTQDYDNKQYYQDELDGCVTQYYRAQMALIANAMALAVEVPTLTPVSVYPGSVAAAKPKKSLGIAETIYQTGFYAFQLDPKQGARASLRAALDPDFNHNNPTNHIHNSSGGEGLLPAGSYLHCDGNPWTVADPSVDDPISGVPYEIEDYAKKVRECALRLSVSLEERAKQNSVSEEGDEIVETAKDEAGGEKEATKKKEETVSDAKEDEVVMETDEAPSPQDGKEPESVVS